MENCSTCNYYRPPTLPMSPEPKTDSFWCSNFDSPHKMKYVEPGAGCDSWAVVDPNKAGEGNRISKIVNQLQGTGKDKKQWKNKKNR